MSEENTSTPPWGDEESNFDANRAWQLIQNLRTEKSELKTQLDSATTEKDAEIARLSGELTDKTTSFADLEAKITGLETSVAEKDGLVSLKDATIAKHQLLSEAGLGLDYADQVVGDDPDAWKGSVAKLQKLAGSSTVQRTPDPVQVAAGGTPPVDKNAEGKAFFGV